jgi:hypothetical protein
MLTEAQDGLQSSLAYIKFPFLRCPQLGGKILADVVAVGAFDDFIRAESSDGRTRREPPAQRGQAASRANDKPVEIGRRVVGAEVEA